MQAPGEQIGLIGARSPKHSEKDDLAAQDGESSRPPELGGTLRTTKSERTVRRAQLVEAAPNMRYFPID